MYDQLTFTENCELFMRLHRAHIAIDKRLGDLIAAPLDQWKPVMATAAEMTELMADLQTVPA